MTISNYNLVIKRGAIDFIDQECIVNIMSEVKKLYRNTEDGMIAGVCAGIGDYFHLDPTLIRLMAVLLTIFSGGLGIFAYIFAWVIIPEKKI